MHKVSRFTQLTGSTAFALLALNPLASQAGLLDNSQVLANYGYGLSIEMQRAAGNADASLAAGGFAVELNAKLKAPTPKAQVVFYPETVTASMLRIVGVTTPAGLEDQPIKVCAEKDSKVLTVLDINQKTGEVTMAEWNGPRVAASPTEPACKAFIVAARNEFNELAAQRQQQQPPRVASAADTRTTANVTPRSTVVATAAP